MEMKEMIYGERKEQPEVLYSGEYREHKFAILSLGTHPTAYVEEKIGLIGYNDFRLNGIAVHGGFTFHNTGHWGNDSKKISWLGWDYAHYDDFMGYYSTDNPFYYHTKQWTTAEIYKEVKSVIKQIIEKEEYANSDEAKCIQAMLQDCREVCYNYSHAEETCRTFYQKGYRKQRDTVREILQDLYNYPHEYHEKRIIELAKEYGVEVEE